MRRSREGLVLAAMCLLVIALSVWGLYAAFATRIELNVDGIFLILVGLLMGGLFALMLYLMAREQGWIPARKREQAPAAAAGHSNPAPAQPQGAATQSTAKPTESKSVSQEAR